MYEHMFSVGNSKSTDSEEDIMIIFENDDYIKEKLKNLCVYRKSSGASVEENGDELIYRDRIIGIEDFFRFLRQFTGKYEVCNSKLLNDKKLESLRKMNKLYTGERYL